MTKGEGTGRTKDGEGHALESAGFRRFEDAAQSRSFREGRGFFSSSRESHSYADFTELFVLGDDRGDVLNLLKQKTAKDWGP